MGVVLTNKNNKEVHMGYISFGFIRQAVAKSYSEIIGKIYEKMYSLRDDIEITNEEYKMIENNLPKHLLEFLYHSDCDGYFKSESVKGIYEELQKTLYVSRLKERFNDCLIQLKNIKKTQIDYLKESGE